MKTEPPCYQCGKPIKEVYRSHFFCAPCDRARIGKYERRVRALEAEGLTRSDAQAVVDTENMA